MPDLKVGIDGTGARAGAREFSQGAATVRRSANQVEGAVGSLTRRIGLLGAAYAGLRVVQTAVRDARDFSRSMGEVATIVDRSTTNMAQLRQGVLDLAAAQGVNRNIVASGLYQTISAGITDAGQAMRFLEQANKLAVAGLADTDSTVRLLAGTLNAYGKDVSEAEDVSDAFFKTVQLGITTIPELAASLSRATPVAAELGISIDELLAAVATLTSQGTPTTEAITQIRGAMNALLLRANDIDDLFKQKLGRGFDIADVEGRGFIQTLLDIRQATGGDVVALREMLQETEAVTGALGLTREEGEAFIQTLEKMADRAGTTGEAFDTMANTADQKLAKAFERLSQAQERLIGNPVVEFFTSVADSMQNVIDKADAYNSLIPDPVELQRRLGLTPPAPNKVFEAGSDEANNLNAFIAGGGGAPGRKFPAQGPPLPQGFTVGGFTGQGPRSNFATQAAGGALQQSVEASRQGLEAIRQGYRDLVQTAEQLNAATDRSRSIRQQVASLDLASAGTDEERLAAQRELLSIQRERTIEAARLAEATEQEITALREAFQRADASLGRSGGVQRGLDEANEGAFEFTSTLENGLTRATFRAGELGATVNNVAQQIGQIFFRQQVAEPIAAQGGDFLSGLLESRHGNVFQNGTVIPHAGGGVMMSPFAFPMGSAIGTGAETEPEAIMPLRRTRSGRLGVEAAGGGGGGQTVVNFNISKESDADSFARSQRQLMDRAQRLGRRR